MLKSSKSRSSVFIPKLRLFNLNKKQEKSAEFITLFYFALPKPLNIWESQVRLGSIKRIVDMTDGKPALQILGSKVLTSYITTPPPSFQSLGITLPYLGVIAKYFGRTFAFEVQVLDSLNARRRIRFSNVQIMSRRNTHMLYVPLNMDIGWNELKIDLNYLLRVGYGTRYKETVRVQIFPNCYLRAIYFSAISVPNNHAIDLIRKSLYPNKTNSENTDPEQLKLTEYTASNFSLLVPTNLQEFLNMKATQNILISGKKVKENLASTSKAEVKPTRTKSSTPSSNSSKQDIIFSISPITPRSTSQLLVLKEADKKFLSEIKKENEKLVRSKKLLVTKSLKKIASGTSIASNLTIGRIGLGAETRKLDFDLSLQGKQLPKSMRKKIMYSAVYNNKGLTGSAIRSKSPGNSSNPVCSSASRSKSPGNSSNPVCSSRGRSMSRSRTTTVPLYNKPKMRTSSVPLKLKYENTKSETATNTDDEDLELEQFPIVQMNFENAVQIKLIPPLENIDESSVSDINDIPLEVEEISHPETSQSNPCIEHEVCTLQIPCPGQLNSCIEQDVCTKPNPCPEHEVCDVSQILNILTEDSIPEEFLLNYEAPVHNLAESEIIENNAQLDTPIEMIHECKEILEKSDNEDDDEKENLLLEPNSDLEEAGAEGSQDQDMEQAGGGSPDQDMEQAVGAEEICHKCSNSNIPTQDNIETNSKVENKEEKVESEDPADIDLDAEFDYQNQ